MESGSLSEVFNLAQVGIDYAIEYGPKIAGALALMFVAWIVAGWLGGVAGSTLRKSKVDETLSRFFGKFVRYAVISMALLTCLGIFGIETTSFAAVIGGATVAIGLAFQGTLSNFSAGIMLLFFRPFKLGEYVKTSSCEGVVQEISLFTTSFNTLDNRHIIVPNGKIFGDVIENYSANTYRRVDVDVGTAYDEDIDSTRRVLESAILTIPNRANNQPHQVFLNELGASSVNWQIRVWCAHEDYWDVWESTVRAAKIALDEQKISIPFPQMQLHIPKAETATIN